MTTALHRAVWLFQWGVRLMPAAVLFSMAFALEGGLRWMGLLGFIPLALAFVPGCTACGGRRACSVEESPDGLRHGYRERAAPPGL